jgi:Fe2+ transport system protein FeoA
MQLVGLDTFKKNDVGIIHHFDESKFVGSNDKHFIAGSIESRLLEMGFIEGATIQLLYKGFLFADPIAVRINNSTSLISLRKNEARVIILEKVRHG